MSTLGYYFESLSILIVKGFSVMGFSRFALLTAPSWATTAVNGALPKASRPYVPFCHPLSQSKVPVIFQPIFCSHIVIIHHLISSMLPSHVSVLLRLVVIGRRSPVTIVFLHFKGTHEFLKKLLRLCHSFILL